MTQTVAVDAAPRARVRLQSSCAQRGNSVVDLISSMDSREVMLKIFTRENERLVEIVIGLGVPHPDLQDVVDVTGQTVCC